MNDFIEIVICTLIACFLYIFIYGLMWNKDTSDAFWAGAAVLLVIVPILTRISIEIRKVKR